MQRERGMLAGRQAQQAGGAVMCHLQTRLMLLAVSLIAEGGAGVKGPCSAELTAEAVMLSSSLVLLKCANTAKTNTPFL